LLKKEKKRKAAEKETVNANANKKAKIKEKKKSSTEEMIKKFNEIKNIDGLEKVNDDPGKFVGAMNKVKEIINFTDESSIKSAQPNTIITTVPQKVVPPVFNTEEEEVDFYKIKYEEAQLRTTQKKLCEDNYPNFLTFLQVRDIQLKYFLSYCAKKNDLLSENTVVTATESK